MRRGLAVNSFAAVLALTAPMVVRAAGPVAGLDSASPYFIHYGSWNSTLVAQARDNFKLVILEPLSNITRARVATIQSGPDQTAGTSDDVIVLGYLTIGEDDRSVIYDGFGEILPVPGGVGPSRDPRTNPLTESIASTVGPGGVPSLGSPTNNGYARFYLDSNGDSLPDRNSTFGGAFVNPGDPEWYTILKSSTSATDGRAGIDEILTTTVGRGLGCNGLFLDTIDTAAPNSFSGTQYEWTAPGFQSLVKSMATDYPSAILCANRGIFFYSPNYEAYQFTLRPWISIMMFESYYTDSSATEVSIYADDNRYTWAPKLNAEANRTDGFTIIGLGYDDAVPISQAVKDQEHLEVLRDQGWLFYRNNATLSAPMNFDTQTWLASNPDVSAPVWDSTAASFTPQGGSGPTPRVGVQELVPGNGALTVRWDVARDQTQPVRYNLYYSTSPTPGPIGDASWTKVSRVTGTAPANYTTGAGTGRYANEQVITGLANGTSYRVAVRAEDSAAVPHEETNTVTLDATPSLNAGVTPSVYATITVDGSVAEWPPEALVFDDAQNDNAGAPSDFRRLWIANDETAVYLRIDSWNAHNLPVSGNRYYFDTDESTATGFNPFGLSILGSEFMMEGSTAYSQGDGGFNDGTISALSVAPTGSSSATSWEFAIPRSLTHPLSLLGGLAGAPLFGANGSTFDVLLTSDNAGPAETLPGTSAPSSYKLASPPPSSLTGWIALED